MATAFENLSPRVIADLMHDLGLTPEQASGVCGNAGAESNFMAVSETKPTVPGSRGGYGWFQLTGDRRVAFEKWAKARSLALDSYAAQYGYLLVELRGSEKKTLDHLRLTETPETAAVTFGYHFERFAGYKKINGNKNYERRADLAQKALALYEAHKPPPEPVEPVEVVTLATLQRDLVAISKTVADLAVEVAKLKEPNEEIIEEDD